MLALGCGSWLRPREEMDDVEGTNGVKGEVVKGESVGSSGMGLRFGDKRDEDPARLVLVGGRRGEGGLDAVLSKTLMVVESEGDAVLPTPKRTLLPEDRELFFAWLLILPSGGCSGLSILPSPVLIAAACTGRFG